MSRDTERAWAAGFFDGEGCVTTGRNNGVSKKKYPSIEISQADPEVLERFYHAVGAVGHINGPYAKKDGTSDMWYYACRSQNEMMAVYNALVPYLSSIKLDAFQKVLEAAKYIKPYNKRLTVDQAEEIRCLAQRGMSREELMIKYNASWHVVRDVLTYRSFK